jgi:hypothetical protein
MKSKSKIYIDKDGFIAGETTGKDEKTLKESRKSLLLEIEN